MQNDVVAEGVSHLFEPNTVLPDQFVSVLRRGSWVEGEKRLLAAVLADAVDCFMKHYRSEDRRAQNLFAEAEEWIFEGDDPGLFTFDGICDVLGLNPDWLREGLTAWKRKQDSRALSAA